MNSYVGFSYIYDKLMSDVDYTAWADYICDLFEKNNVKPSSVLDLGCGTGSLTIEMAKRGYEMIGIDSSMDMLAIAESKAKKDGLDIMFLNQNMTDFELYGSVGAIISTMDCINYITSTKELSKMLSNIDFYLEPGGVFIFDINSEYKIKEVISENVFTYDNADIYYVWESEYNKRNCICKYFLTFFVENEGRYYRIDECHKQRAYKLQEINDLVSNSGMKVLNVYDNLSFSSPHKKSERLFFLVGK